MVPGRSGGVGLLDINMIHAALRRGKTTKDRIVYFNMSDCETVSECEECRIVARYEVVWCSFSLFFRVK